MDQILNNSCPSDGASPDGEGLEAQGASSAERLAAMMARSAQSSAVFGEPVHQGTSIIIPVAKAILGVGGGSGPANSGEGGGGGMRVAPLGFIHLENGRARFHPLRKSALSLGATAALVGALLFVGRQLRLIRRDMRSGTKDSSRRTSQGSTDDD